MKEITRVVKAYEDSINQNRIVGSVCNDCKTIAVPPRPVCRKCNSDDVDITTVIQCSMTCCRLRRILSIYSKDRTIQALHRVRHRYLSSIEKGLVNGTIRTYNQGKKNGNHIWQGRR